MTVSVFDDKSKEPTSSELDKALGETATLLKNIEQHVLEQFGELTHEWKFYSKKAGWTLALAHKGRRVLHLIPQPDQFTVVFTLGERAVSTALESNLPKETLSAIESARKYAEGRSFRFDVTTTDDVSVVRQLIEIKMSS
jgi:hypothetical protein